MSDPVRLYNPNPDAPDVWGAPPTKRNRLAEVLANIPSPFDVFAPPPAARKAYGSLAQTLVDATAPAAVRDTVDASGQTMDALRQGRGWDAAGGVASMLTAAAGVLPGGRLITKGAKEVQPVARLMAPTSKEAETATGWAFKDVSAPHGRMQPGDWRKVTNALDEGSYQNVELPISSMYATQQSVNPDFRNVANPEAPFVIKKDGNYFLQDGHHRAMRAAADGKQTIPVRLVDVDGTTQTNFPLLDLLRKYGLLPVAAGTAVAGATLSTPQPEGGF